MKDSVVDCTCQADMVVESRHRKTGAVIRTQAAIVEKPAYFSAIDLCATGLASCILNILEGYARVRNMNVAGMHATVTTSIDEQPFRIRRILVDIFMPDGRFSPKDRIAMPRAIRTCPIHKSLHPDIEQIFSFHWPD